MGRNVTQKLIADHLVEGEMTPGSEIGLRIDQTLTQDATGTMVMLELEAMGIDRVQTELSCQYVDHNLIQADHKNPDDHLFFAQRLSKVRRLVQSSGQRCQPSCPHGTLWYPRQDDGGLRQPHAGGRIVGDAGNWRRRA